MYPLSLPIESGCTRKDLRHETTDPAHRCTLAHNPEEERKAQEAAAAAVQAQKEAKAEDVAKQYDMAVAAQDWSARACTRLAAGPVQGHRGAERIAAGFDEVKAKGDAARDLRRMQALWQYNQIPVGNKGNQVSAQIYSKERVDVDGSGAKCSWCSAIIRWKRHAYLVLQAGDFRCPQCTVSDRGRRQAGVDGGVAPKTDEAIALFITDQKALWKLARKGKSISIEFPVKAGGTRTAVFETGGVDASRMPQWWQ